MKLRDEWGTHFIVWLNVWATRHKALLWRHCEMRTSFVAIKAFTGADFAWRDDSVKRLELNTAQMVFTITSGSETYWSSTDCQQNPTNQPIILMPATPVTTQAVTWDRTRSSADTCDQQRDPVPTGGASYHLAVSLDGIEGATTQQFILE